MNQEYQTDTPNEPNDTTVIQPDDALPSVTLDDLPDWQQKVIAKVGWQELTRVQTMAIPYIQAERDMMIQSRTGSGKTAAFVLPLLEKIDPSRNHTQAMVLVPTRELAQQVTHEVDTLRAGSDVRSIAVYGGVGYGPQIEALRGGAHFVVGTPGRILDHLLKKNLRLDNLRYLIFDEADRMLSMGFYPDMRRIATHLPKSYSGFMFSATYPATVKRLANQFLHEPGTLSLSHDVVYATETEHMYYQVPTMEKDRALVRIIEVENPDSAIIFCNTKRRVSYVATVLQRFGYDADELTADLNQKARDRVMKRLRDHSLRYLVATDIAARGIDITNLSCVFNYEVPEDLESYIHRTGRTGRAGASGEAISLVCPSEVPDFKRIAKRYNIDMVLREVPTDENVTKVVSERLIALLEARYRDADSIERERMQRLVPLVETFSQDREQWHLLTMVLDEADQANRRGPLATPVVKDDAADEPSQSQSSGDGATSETRSGRRRNRSSRNRSGSQPRSRSRSRKSSS